MRARHTASGIQNDIFGNQPVRARIYTPRQRRVAPVSYSHNHATPSPAPSDSDISSNRVEPATHAMRRLVKAANDLTRWWRRLGDERWARVRQDDEVNAMRRTHLKVSENDE